MAKPLLSEKDLHRRQKLGGHLAAATATLGLAGLATKGAGIGATKFGIAGSKAALWGPKADRAANTLSVTAGGLGGAAGFNSARLSSDASRRKINKPMQVQAPVQPKGVKPMPTGTKPMGVTQPKKPKSPVAKASDWMNISEHERRARDSRRTAHRGTNTAGLAGTAVALTAAHHAAYGKGRPDPFTQAHGLTQSFQRSQKAVGWKGAAQAAPKLARNAPHGAAVLAAGAAAAGGLAVAGGARINEKRHNMAIGRLRKQRAKGQTVFKAYDPERNRQNRLSHYQTAAAAGSGALGTAAVFQAKSAVGKKPIYGEAKQVNGGTIRRRVNAGTGLRSQDLKMFKGGLRKAGAAGALAGAAVGAGIASEHIGRYKKERGATYRPLPSSY